MAQLHVRSNKRQKLVIGSLGLAVGLASSVSWPWFGWSLVPLLGLSYLVAVWVLDFDLRGREWSILPLYIMATSVTSFVALLWYGSSLWWRWMGVGLYAVVIYALLLTINILNVATVRALPLARQALSFLSLAGVVGLFALSYLVLGLRPNLAEWSAAVAMITAIMAWPLIWAAKLGQGSSRTEIGWTLLLAWLGAQLAIAAGLWPISYMTCLAVAGGVSVSIGLIHHHINRQLTRPLQQQYLVIGGALLLCMYAATRW